MPGLAWVLHGESVWHGIALPGARGNGTHGRAMGEREQTGDSPRRNGKGSPIDAGSRQYVQTNDSHIAPCQTDRPRRDAPWHPVHPAPIAPGVAAMAPTGARCHGNGPLRPAPMIGTHRLTMGQTLRLSLFLGASCNRPPMGLCLSLWRRSFRPVIARPSLRTRCFTS